MVSNNTKIIFEFYYGFFIGTTSYQKYIEYYFFNELIDKNICFKSNRTTYNPFLFFDVYYCKEENLIDIKKFPELRFFKKETNTTFIFNF